MVNCVFADYKDKCNHPDIKKKYFIFKPLCVRSPKQKHFQRCKLQVYKHERI